MLDEANSRLEEMSYQKQRANTVYANDDQLALRAKELEAELNALKSENASLSNHIVELNAQILKHSMEASGGGRFIVNLTTQNHVTHKGPSLADELDKMSSNEVMEALKLEQQISQRLTEYIDNILTRIMEHSPELLEKCLMR